MGVLRRLTPGPRVRACVPSLLVLLAGFGAAGVVGQWLLGVGVSRPVVAVVSLGVYLPVYGAVVLVLYRRQLRVEAAEF